MTSIMGTPLCIATKRGYLEIVVVLLLAGADINKATANDGETPLYLASLEGHFEILNTLIAAGSNVDQSTHAGETPLYIASCLGYLNIVQSLTRAGANFLRKSNRGRSPLDVASSYEIRQFITKHPWYRRRNLIVMKPHMEAKGNHVHRPTLLGALLMDGNTLETKNLRKKVASYL